MARIVSSWLGSACSRFVAYTSQPLIGYGLPVSVASRIPDVMVSLAKGYLWSGLSTLPRSECG